MCIVYMFCRLVCFFFFKQKTAYEMRISDWSSDVCSSDLRGRRKLGRREKIKLAHELGWHMGRYGHRTLPKRSTRGSNTSDRIRRSNVQRQRFPRMEPSAGI